MFITSFRSVVVSVWWEALDEPSSQSESLFKKTMVVTGVVSVSLGRWCLEYAPQMEYAPPMVHLYVDNRESSRNTIKKFVCSTLVKFLMLYIS